ncbi:MAG: Mce-associated rane protein [Mycobacterium sp.]|jgi:Mce-associated membrane protein|nr:Mce-associated rane protein [Mycobacterium sp.]
MADAEDPHEESVTSTADALALIEEAEAEAAEAEALAAAARARARAARLRREALALAEVAEDYGDAAAAAADAQAADEYAETGDEYHDEADEYGEYYDEPDEESADDAEAAAPEPETTGRPRWLPSVAAVAAIVLIVGFAAASAYMARQHRDATQREKRETAFVAGAKKGVVNMTSLDFTKAKADVQRVIDSSTGTFRDDFQQRANDFITVVEQSKAVTEGTVNAAALESVQNNSAVVLVSATSRVTNSPPGKVEPPKIWRLRITVDDAGGQYKMSKVEYVP